MKLRQVLENIEGGYKMRIAAKNIRVRIIQESQAPQSGAFFWLPTKDGDWKIDVYYDSDLPGDTAHSVMWNKYVIERLASMWGRSPSDLRSLKGRYTAVPRGRVSRVPNGWVVVHGGEIKNTEQGIFNAFNLNRVKSRTKVFIDDHEQMLEGDPERLQSILGVDLGLKGLTSQQILGYELDDEPDQTFLDAG
jgi:hypothetical protein